MTVMMSMTVVVSMMPLGMRTAFLHFVFRGVPGRFLRQLFCFFHGDPPPCTLIIKPRCAIPRCRHLTW